MILRTALGALAYLTGDLRATIVVFVMVIPGVVRRLVEAVLLEIADEWRVGRRYFSLETMARPTEPGPLLVAEPLPFH